jgi:hypothetical protein
MQHEPNRTVMLNKQPPPQAPTPAPERMFEIEVALANDGEPRDIFVGADGRNFMLRRGAKVIVPEGVISVLKDAVKGVAEVDPNDDTKSITVQRQRFSYTIHRQVS